MAPAPGLRDLPPGCARLCLKVEAFTASLAPEGLRGGALVAAFSGGLDSTALLVILSVLAPRMGFTLSAAHLDHGLRPASAQDALFCRDFCRERSIEFESARRDVTALAASWGTGVEDAGRRARYAWLEEVRQRRGALAVACGHQLDDLAEDQLMRLARGAGWPALGGMPAWDARRRLLRPLLLTPKDELRGFLRECGIVWREDETNQDEAFTRNRVRAQVLPLFVRENPDYLANAAERWRQARIDETHWNEEVLRAGGGAFSSAREVFLTASVLGGASQALRLRLYKRAVESLGPGQPLADTLHGLDRAWRERSTGKAFQFPGAKLARVERGGIRFLPAQPATSVDTSLPEG